MIYQTPFRQFGFQNLHIETETDDNLLRQLPEHGLGIVGTRYPQRRSFDIMEKTISSLKDSELIIVSGFARGIDSRAHELAIEYGLKTIAILGCGLNIDYPRENRLLRKKILNTGGMIISPFDSNTPALPQNFLNRNKLIPYFSKAVWVVEAATISGTLNTANHTATMDRDLYATSCFPDDPFFEGNQKLLSQKEPEKYPIADPFFGADSLLKTWKQLNLPAAEKKKKRRIDRKGLSQIQKWVLDLEYEYGECNILNLKNFAINQGIEPGEFFKNYAQELSTGKLKQDSYGKVALG